jgi:sensor histidine kinase YesM
MKREILLRILIMYLFYILWTTLDAAYLLYFYSEKERLIFYTNLYKLIPGLFICIIFIIIHEKIEKKYYSRRDLLLFISVIYTIVISMLDAFIMVIIIYFYANKGINFDFDLLLTTFINWILFFFGSGILLYFITYHRKSIEQGLQLKITKSLANEARLEMLRYQINPHFLFNALNTIQAVIQTDKTRAKVIIGDLSEFFRYTLSKNDQIFVKLGEEIAALKNYLSIQKERFGDSLNISYEIDNNLIETKIPFFIIHPLVENAIKYGFVSGDSILILLVKVEKIENGYTILVRNSGKLKNGISFGLNNQSGTKTGINNLKNRLFLSYPDSHEFALYEENGYVNAIVKIKEGGSESNLFSRIKD